MRRSSSFPMASLSSTRRGIATRVIIIVLAVAVLGAVGIWGVIRSVRSSAEGDGPIMVKVERGRFIHEITERGSVESASNVDIRCEVQSKGSGTMILTILPEGTSVMAGDEICTLDSSSLEEQLTQQQIVCNGSAASVIQADANFKTAEIAKKEYVEGRYKEAELTITNKIFSANEAQRRNEEYLEFSRRLLERGYITELQVKADEFAVLQSEKSLQAANLELTVLQNYTVDKMLLQLDSDIETSRARLASEQHSHELDLERLQLVEDQVEKCTILAPEDGQIVYANQTDRRGGQEIIIEEGVTVRERQIIIRLPDPKRMQVKAKINEGNIALVSSGMRAKIRLDAFSELELDGVVEKVNEYPVPSSFMSSAVKEYETYVRIDTDAINAAAEIDDTQPQLRPGLTAEVKIVVNQLDDVLMVPVQAVFEHGGQIYAIVIKDEKWQAKPVQIGAASDKDVVILSGLEEGEEVVQGVRNFRDRVDLPEIDESKNTDSMEENGSPRESDGTVGPQRSAVGGGMPAADLSSKKPAAPTTEPAAETAKPADLTMEIAPPPTEPTVEAIRPAGGEARGPRSPGGDPAAMFEGRDTDKDGKLTGEEIPPMPGMLERMDTDKDGAISREEFLASPRGGPGGGRQGAGTGGRQGQGQGGPQGGGRQGGERPAGRPQGGTGGGQ